MPLPNWTNTNRRVMRAPVNPLDKSTVVSVYPKEIHTIKYTVFPGEFLVPAGSKDKPAILVVGPSSWWREVEENQTLEIPTSSVAIADSIVKDYCLGLVACSIGAAQPGLFVLPGEYTVEKIVKDQKPLLDAAILKQRKWYELLVHMADVLWANTNGNPRCISDDMRLAATELNFKDKPWLKDFEKMKLTNCPACGNLLNDIYPVCPNCKTIVNEAAWAKLGLKKAV